MPHLSSKGQGEVLCLVLMSLVAVGLWSLLIYDWTHPTPKLVLDARRACRNLCLPNVSTMYQAQCYCDTKLRKAGKDK